MIRVCLLLRHMVDGFWAEMTDLNGLAIGIASRIEFDGKPENTISGGQADEAGRDSLHHASWDLFAGFGCYLEQPA